MKKALITGITGQDGSYLAEFLLEKGYDVHGVIRRSSVDYRERIAHLEGHPHFHLHYGDLSDSMSILSVVSTVRPDTGLRLQTGSCRAWKTSHFLRAWKKQEGICGEERHLDGGTAGVRSRGFGT